ncbi:hypothetical protein Ahy_A05g022641 isoform A [Arachis hypogaea]|uniref:Cyclic nucleotide-binding domain-containing protein n=1 Tax=Arachis hypogaea TaxID=3818 RepID=A0A445D162_ARAHY|nr:hypothetical protein Ahy_A05g022641 isoform A [Arachis hypogaea]
MYQVTTPTVSHSHTDKQLVFHSSLPVDFVKVFLPHTPNAPHTKTRLCQGNMASFEKDEEPMLLETRGLRSDEHVDSNFRRLVTRTRSASMSIPMVSMESSDREATFVGHTGPLRTVRKIPFPQMSGPLYPTQGTGNSLQRSRVVAGNNVGESRIERFRNTGESHWNNNNDRKNEHLLRSGQLGMCNDPYCTTCPANFKAAQQGNSRTSYRRDPVFHNVLYGDAKVSLEKFTHFSLLMFLEL